MESNSCKISKLKCTKIHIFILIIILKKTLSHAQIMYMLKIVIQIFPAETCFQVIKQAYFLIKTSFITIKLFVTILNPFTVLKKLQINQYTLTMIIFSMLKDIWNHFQLIRDQFQFSVPKQFVENTKEYPKIGSAGQLRGVQHT